MLLLNTIQYTAPEQMQLKCSAYVRVCQRLDVDVSGVGFPALTFVWGLCHSSQRSAARTRSLTEELEETRRAFKEAQERASRTQASCSKLVKSVFCHHSWQLRGSVSLSIIALSCCFFIEGNEVESLRVQIRRLEDKVGELLHFRKLCFFAFLASFTCSLSGKRYRVLSEQTSRIRNTIAHKYVQ